MSEMNVNIRRVVDEDVSSRTTQWHVLYEGILNSIHANASEITCRLSAQQEVIKTDNGEDIVNKKVDKIEIEDNGDGFDDANYKSFTTYRTDHKIDLGCKGIGRFVFLKIFNEARFISYLKNSQKKRQFDFSVNFDSDKTIEEKANVTENKTILSLSGISSHDSLIERRLELNLQEIRNRVLQHLVPTLFFEKRRGRNIQIIFIDTSNTEKPQSISESDIPNFSTKSFTIQDRDNKIIDFNLHYHISNDSEKVKCFHCANRRTVCTFSEKDFKPQGFSGWLLLESEYFDKQVNNDRNDFFIYPVKTDLFNTISWEMVNDTLKIVISELVHQAIPEVDSINKTTLQEIQEERPYLSQYIEEDDIAIAGFINKKQIIERAKKRFDEAKDRLITHAAKPEYTDEELDEAIQIAQSELIAYIQDRILVLQRLKKMLKDKERSEKLIHNLFMERYAEDTASDYSSLKRNNLWLLDDRFTSYSYAASDKKIGHILAKRGTPYDDDKPDLALFFSHDPNNKDGLKSVIIELKSFKDTKKSDRDKFAGIQQLRDYTIAFQSKEEIEEVWAFLVTDVDEALAKRLQDDAYAPLFSMSTPIYHRYYERLKTSIYVVGVESLILDAEARNKVFIDIINKQSRLAKHFSPPQKDERLVGVK